MKVGYNGEKVVLHFILPQNISNLWSSWRCIWYEKTKSVWTSTKYIAAAVVSFKKNGVVPATTKEELDTILEKHPKIKEVFLDWTERPVQRSSWYAKQKKDYSGKKKKHTKKNMIVTWDNKMILAVWETSWGKEHDYELLKKSWFMDVLVAYVIWVDLWFQWIKSHFPNHNVQIPKKNYKKRPLTEEEKDDNYLMASIRVIIENIIGRAKKYRIIANRFRGRLRWEFSTVKSNRKHVVMLVVWGLYNIQKSWLFIS